MRDACLCASWGARYKASTEGLGTCVHRTEPPAASSAAPAYKPVVVCGTSASGLGARVQLQSAQGLHRDEVYHAFCLMCSSVKLARTSTRIEKILSCFHELLNSHALLCC
jgi:hypothetical protein